jgi:NDP-sugar pyrophosphorylase family protein
MMAVILAGGRGTRLKPFTITIPKPLLPVGDFPILDILIQQLVNSGVQRIVLTLGHMAPLFKAYVGNGKYGHVQIDYLIEDEPLGTAGPLRLIQDLDENFLVLNGDLLTTLDFDAFLRFHMERRAWGSIAVNQRKVHIDYGVVRPTEDGRLKEYDEKPTLSYSVSMGINALSKGCVDFIPASGRFDMPDLMMAMKKAGRPVFCYETDCYWQDIGRFDDYEQATADFTQAPSRFLGRRAAAAAD